MCKISIITINKDNAVGLESTIQSVINQTYKDIEYLIIDGASSDNSLAIIKKYSNSISTYISERDNGLYNAMNKGQKMATGEYLFFLNSGDVLYKNNTLELVADKLHNIDVLFGNTSVIYNLKILINVSTPIIEYYKRYQHDIPPQPALFVKKECFGKVGGFDESYRIIADVVFVSRLFADINTTYKYIDEVISVFDTTGVSSQEANQEKIYLERKRFITTEFPQYLNDFEKIYNKNFINRLVKRITKLMGNK